jgi:hypothetical protein
MKISVKVMSRQRFEYGPPENKSGVLNTSHHTMFHECTKNPQNKYFNLLLRKSIGTALQYESLFLIKLSPF